MSDESLRRHLIRLLDWSDAHADFDAAVENIPEEMRGVQPAGLPHSAWQLLEHLRITQRDILAFCTHADYAEPEWPREYWPGSAEPPGESSWRESVASFRRDRDALKELAGRSELNLLTEIRHGSGQTYLRELLLVADHTSYHVGQLVLVRRALGVWGRRAGR